MAAGFNDSTWKPALRSLRSDDWRAYVDTLLVIRGTFELDDLTNETEVNLFTKSIVENQSIYVNGHLLASNIKRDAPNQAFRLTTKYLIREETNMPSWDNDSEKSSNGMNRIPIWVGPNNIPFAPMETERIQWPGPSDRAIDEEAG